MLSNKSAIIEAHTNSKPDTVWQHKTKNKWRKNANSITDEQNLTGITPPAPKA